VLELATIVHDSFQDSKVHVLMNRSLQMHVRQFSFLFWMFFCPSLAAMADWPQWGGSPLRNNAPFAKSIPDQFDFQSSLNIRWETPMGSETFGTPVVANGRIYVGTNNWFGYLDRLPREVDLGVLLCLNQEDGEFRWQYSSEKLPTGRIHDMPNQGICASPWVDGERLWVVTNRCEVVCLDTLGFQDGENDGPITSEASQALNEADVIWKFDMMAELKVLPHNMSTCSVTGTGDLLFVSTSHGVDDSHRDTPNSDAPSFICMNKNSGQVLWTDNSPGTCILHGQWSSPAYAVLEGQAQVIFAGGDGWLYSFDPNGSDGHSMLLWKFDCNPKESVYRMVGATRNPIVGCPVIYNGLVYVAVGDDPENACAPGHLWCINPNLRGDVSPTLVFNKANLNQPVPHQRIQALKKELGDFELPNPNSAEVWHYVGTEPKNFETTMHRTCGSVAIAFDILYVADFGGILHCLNAKTGQLHWTHDLEAAVWSSPLIVDNKVFVGDEDGDVMIAKHSTKFELIDDINLGAAIYTSPIVSNDTLYIATRKGLFAIGH
jgi:outer membrane protein assembly factor BamB